MGGKKSQEEVALFFTGTFSQTGEHDHPLQIHRFTNKHDHHNEDHSNFSSTITVGHPDDVSFLGIKANSLFLASKAMVFTVICSYLAITVKAMLLQALDCCIRHIHNQPDQVSNTLAQGVTLRPCFVHLHINSCKDVFAKGAFLRDNFGQAA